MDASTLASIESQVAQLSLDEQIALAAWVNRLIDGVKNNDASKKEVLWESIRGILQDGPDPLEFQRHSRSEWDRDPA